MNTRYCCGTGAAIISSLFSLMVAFIFHIAPGISQERPHGTNAFGNRDQMDTGEVKSHISVDKENPEAISGFVHIPIIKGQNTSSLGADEEFAQNLAYTLKQYTRIEIKRDGVIGLDSPKLQKYPVIFILWSGRFTTAEEQNLRNYLSSGGFAFLVLGGSWNWKEYYSKFARFDPIPKDHPIYITLFKDTGNPDTPLYLRGLWIGNRLAGIDIIGFRDKITPGNTDDRYRKLLASCMVYALAQ
jgi:hypothetical protein